jgi:hypothetical protein
MSKTEKFCSGCRADVDYRGPDTGYSGVILEESDREGVSRELDIPHIPQTVGLNTWKP